MVNLSAKEEISVEEFRKAACLLTGKEHIYLQFLVSPTPVGNKIEVIYVHEDENCKTSFKKDVTDYDLW